MHGEIGTAYTDTYKAVMMFPAYGKCRELTDEEIEDVANDRQPGHAYWQTWDIVMPEEE